MLLHQEMWEKGKAGENCTVYIYQNEIMLWVFTKCSDLLIYSLMKVALTQEKIIYENPLPLFCTSMLDFDSLIL